MIKNRKVYIVANFRIWWVKMTLSLKQRRWTTKVIDLIVTDPLEDLVKRVEDAYHGLDATVKEPIFFDHNTIALSDLGLLKQGKKGTPVVKGSHGNWYLLLANENVEPGNFYQGTLNGKEKRKKKYDLLGDHSSYVGFNRDEVTLEDALKFGVGNCPIYEGPIQEFKKGWGQIKFSRPIDARIKTIDKTKSKKEKTQDKDEDVKIKYALIVSQEDYDASFKFLKKKRYNTKPALQSYSTQHAISTESQGITVERSSKKQLKIPHYRSPTSMTKEVKEQLAFQKGEGGKDYLTMIEGLDDMLESVIKDAEFRVKNVDTNITRLEKINLNSKYWRGESWIANTSDPSELYLILNHPQTGIIYEIAQDGKKEVKFTPPRAISHGLVIWPNDTLTPKEVVASKHWMLGVGNQNYLNGYVANPNQELYPTQGAFKGGKICGILGMNDPTWRAMLVKQATNQIFEGLRKQYRGVDTLLSKGIGDEHIIGKAGEFYSANPLLETVSGGETPFVKSVLHQFRKNYEVPQRQILLK